MGTFIASLFNAKARKWVKGRKGIFEKLEATIPAGEKIIWVHCASLGEFEQGRPLMDQLRVEAPGHRILLTFFSPSGYEVQKDYPGADWVFYLPLDGPVRARRFLEIVHPSLVIFVKYEFWYYYLKKIKYRGIPLLLISALFRKDMSFFRWYGGLQRKILSRFDQLFVQNESSRSLLEEIGLGDITQISGDTRFDRVVSIAGKSEALPLIERFAGACRLLVAGSTWREDELMLGQSRPFLESNKLKLVIAPHEISEKDLLSLEDIFPGAVRYSQLENQTGNPDSPWLIIDNIGMLSRLYKYGYCCFVGGGMNRNGVHNVLEAAVYDKPVFFGPNYKKYQEAIGLADAGGAFVTGDSKTLTGRVQQFMTDEIRYREACRAAGEYVRGHAGATGLIMHYIQENRLLTS